MKIAVIGGGASGIIASIVASKNNDVTLFERNDKCGKKLLLTGNGKCNYWNSNISVNNYNTDDLDGLKKILNRQNDTLTLLADLGIYPTIKNGLFYPYSGTSYSIKEIFDHHLKNVNIIYNTKVIDIKKENKFKVFTENETYEFDKVILACGSKACPKTGSDGLVFDILKRLGHKINPVLPSLVQVKTNGSYLKEWDGLRCEASVRLYIDDIFIKEECGEVQLTNYGLSGICVFNLTSFISKALYNKQKVNLKINFFNQDFKIFMDERSNAIKGNIAELIESIFNYKLSNIFYQKSGVDKNKKWFELTEKEKIKFGQTINEFNVDILSTNDFDKAQVATGGIPLMEINPLTMESKKVNGLYIVGETLDVDGICGGFNLAFAFITGLIAGELND